MVSETAMTVFSAQRVAASSVSRCRGRCDDSASDVLKRRLADYRQVRVIASQSGQGVCKASRAERVRRSRFSNRTSYRDDFWRPAWDLLCSLAVIVIHQLPR